MAKGVTIDFNANLARFSQSMDKATKELNRFQQNAEKRSQAISRSFKGIAVGTLVAGFVAATKGAINYADSIADASERTAFSIRKLQELKLAAEQNGVAFNELESGLARFTKRLGLARIGTGAAVKTYEQLGINLNQSNEQVFKQVVETLGNLDDETNRLAITTRLFGDDAQRLAVVFKDGNAGLEGYAQRAKELGLILSDDLVQGASEANDQLDIMAKVVQAQLTKGLAALAPVITSVGNAFSEAAVYVAEFFESFSSPEQQGLKVAQDTLDASNERLEQLRERLAKASEIRKPLAERGRSLTGREVFGGLIGNYDPEKIRKEIEKELELNVRLQKRLIDLQKEFETPSQKPKAGNIAGLFGSGDGGSGGDKAIKAAEQEAKRYADALQRLRDELDPAAAKTRELQESIDLLNRAFFSEGDIGPEEYSFLIQQLTTDTEALREAERKLAEDRSRATELIKGLDSGAYIRDQIVEVQRLRDAFPELSDSLADVELELQAKWDKIGEDGEKAAEQAKSAWESLGPVFTSAFEDAIVGGGKLSDVLRGLEQDIIRIITRMAITEPLGNFFGSMLGGGGSGSNIFTSLFGFASGGKFVVGGTGGTDSQLVAFRATPGEQVEVRTPAQQREGGRSVVNNFSFVLPSDGVNYRRTAQQVAREASRMMQFAQAGV